MIPISFDADMYNEAKDELVKRTCKKVKGKKRQVKEERKEAEKKKELDFQPVSMKSKAIASLFCKDVKIDYSNDFMVRGRAPGLKNN